MRLSSEEKRRFFRDCEDSSFSVLLSTSMTVPHRSRVAALPGRRLVAGVAIVGAFARDSGRDLVDPRPWLGLAGWHADRWMDGLLQASERAEMHGDR